MSLPLYFTEKNADTIAFNMALIAIHIYKEQKCTIKDIELLPSTNYRKIRLTCLYLRDFELININMINRHLEYTATGKLIEIGDLNEISNYLKKCIYNLIKEKGEYWLVGRNQKRIFAYSMKYQ